MLRRCGADACLRVEPEASLESREESGKGFKACSRCLRRRYCSTECQKSDWALHKGECTRQFSEMPVVAAPAVPAPAATTWLKEISKGEDVILTGLISKPHLNGRVGRILGPRTDTGRQPVSVDGSSVAIKPGNMYRLGVTVVRAGAPRRFRCTEHEKELCELCCIDLSIISNLCKLQKAQGGAPIPITIIERVAAAHFNQIKRNIEDDVVGRCSDSPLCDGIPVAERRAVLAAALKVKEPSLAVAATVAAMACFGARDHDLTRALVPEHIEKVINMPSPLELT